MLETLMMDPPYGPSAILVPTSAVSRNGPFRLTPSTLSHSSSLTEVRSGYRGDMPALFTSTSTRPKAA